MRLIDLFHICHATEPQPYSDPWYMAMLLTDLNRMNTESEIHKSQISLGQSKLHIT